VLLSLWALLAGFALASAWDLRTGRVPSPLTDALLLLGALAYLASPHEPEQAWVSLLVLATVALWHRARFVGGADVKLACALCLLSPLRAHGFAQDGAAAALPPLLPFPVAVLVLAVLAAQAVALALLAVRLLRSGRAPALRRREAPLGLAIGALLFLALHGDVGEAAGPVLVAVATAALMLARGGDEVRLPLAPFLLLSAAANLALPDPFALLVGGWGGLASAPAPPGNP
jgi:Flp pilus assembly protein protease CpaA